MRDAVVLHTSSSRTIELPSLSPNSDRAVPEDRARPTFATVMAVSSISSGGHSINVTRRDLHPARVKVIKATNESGPSVFRGTYVGMAFVYMCLDVDGGPEDTHSTVSYRPATH